jgi:hypothetical protein
MYTQFNACPPVSYKAIEDGFTALNVEYNKTTVMIPKIGAGLAGGNWDIISNIIDSCSTNNDIVVVEFYP